MEYKSENRICQNCKKDFAIEPDDFSFYEKIKVPAPTFCPLCRAERRFCFRNERQLFKVKDFFTGENIFSLYPPNCKSITREEWFGDSWDAIDQGQDFDFSKNLLLQINELSENIPHANLRVQLMENSPYCANATGLKNSYLLFNSTYSENCMYGNAVDGSRDCIDNSHIKKSERCYNCFWLQDCYQCYFTIMSVESSNLWFCRDCLGCNNCFGCANLRKASYCIFNKKYNKDEYETIIKDMQLDTRSGISKARELCRNFWDTQPTKYSQGLKNINSTGSYVTNCKNVQDSFLVRDSENMKYCQLLQVPTNKDCYDCTAWGANMELDYEDCLCGDHSYNVKFSSNCWPACKDVEYSIDLVNCSDCFGCVGLKKKQYCILNKQYTKEEYFEMIEKIKKHMDDMPYIDKKGNIYKYGEFFPIEFSSFGYNNTMASQYFNLITSKEEAEKSGYPWIEIPHGEYQTTISAEELPDSCNELKNNILKETIECSLCKNAYRILEDEFLFYKKEKLPLPNLCNECRYKIRISDRLKLELYNRKCMCGGISDINGKYKNTIKHTHEDAPCGETFKTGYSPDGNEIVYCEKCYQQEVY